MKNIVRWSADSRLSPLWERRSEFASRLIPRDLAILDFGCGGMHLEKHARPSRYIPADITARDDRTRIIDLNEQDIPDAWLKEADLVSFMGVLEYIDDPEKHLKAIAASGNTLLFSYNTIDLVPETKGERTNWVNDYSAADIEALLERCGFRILHRVVFSGEQHIYVAAPTGNVPAWFSNRFAMPEFFQPSLRDVNKRPSLVLCGFYGRGNCGDEALLQCVYEAFKDSHDIVISVDEHGAHPGFWDWYPYTSARIIHQTNLQEFFFNVQNVGLLVGGGGLPPGFAANQASAARIARRKTAIAGIDAFWELPLLFSEEVNRYLNLFDIVAARHALSPGEAPALQLQRPAIHGGDWALNLPVDTGADVVVDHKRALITVRELELRMVCYDFALALKRICRHVIEAGYHPVLLPLCPEDERFIAEMALGDLAPVERNWWNPRRVKQSIASSGMMLSIGRLHPLIFAAGTGTPVASVTIPLASGGLGRAARKISFLATELGIAQVGEGAELDAFLADPKPADPVLVAASKARLAAMVAALKAHFAD